MPQKKNQKQNTDAYIALQRNNYEGHLPNIVTYREDFPGAVDMRDKSSIELGEKRRIEGQDLETPKEKEERIKTQMDVYGDPVRQSMWEGIDKESDGFTIPQWSTPILKTKNGLFVGVNDHRPRVIEATADRLHDVEHEETRNESESRAEKKSEKKKNKKDNEHKPVIGAKIPIDSQIQRPSNSKKQKKDKQKMKKKEEEKNIEEDEEKEE